MRNWLEGLYTRWHLDIGFSHLHPCLRKLYPKLTTLPEPDELLEWHQKYERWVTLLRVGYTEDAQQVKNRTAATEYNVLKSGSTRVNTSGALHRMNAPGRHRCRENIFPRLVVLCRGGTLRSDSRKIGTRGTGRARAGRPRIEGSACAHRRRRSGLRLPVSPLWTFRR